VTRAVTARQYASSDARKRSSGRGSFGQMQTTRPRDLGALIFAIGVLVVLFIVSLSVGAPLR